MWFLLAACQPAPTLPACTDALAAPTVAVVYTDFVSGALGLSGDTVGCPVQGGASIGGDPLVRSDGERLYVVKRSDADAVSAFDLEDPSVPLWETVLPTGTNVHDLLAWRDQVWLTSFGDGALLTLDPRTGALARSTVIGQTLSGAAVVDDTLFVADQRFALDERVDGALLVVDPDTGEAAETVDVGPNPRIEADGDGLLVATGYYAFAPATFDADLVDGALYRYERTAGLASVPLLTEAELGGDLHAVVPTEAGFVAVVVDRDGRSTLTCRVDGRDLQGPSTPGWYIAGTAVDDEVVLARRSTLIGGEASTTPPGLLALDPLTCTERAFHPTTLQPYDLVTL